jgi:hypothetical protein
MAQTSRAIVASVEFGFTTIEGIMLPNGSYAIGVPQIATLIGTSKNTISRDLKRLLGDDFCPDKIVTELGNQKVNVVSLEVAEKLIFVLAQKGNSKAVRFWNRSHPDIPLLAIKETKKTQGIESLIEDYAAEMYREFNPRRQISTDFGVADIVHDYGVLEIKEFKSMRSAHTAMGQAMSYGAILNKQPEVLLYNVPDKEIQRVLAMFTGVGMLVWLYNKKDTKAALARERWYPTYSNTAEIQFQIATQ